MKIRIIVFLLMIIGMNTAVAYTPPLEKGKEIFSLRWV